MRILLKLSGEALMGKFSYGIDNEFLNTLVKKIIAISNEGHEIAIVVGSGNIFRGLGEGAKGMMRNNADMIGMVATIMNSVALHDSFQNQGKESQIFCAKTIDSIGKLFTYEDAVKEMKDGKIVIIGGGTGNPFFTTDTAGILRALELECEYVVKATKVDYLYDKDPKKFDDAKPIKRTTFMEVLEKDLRIMDLTAISLAKENKIKLLIMNIEKLEKLIDFINGDEEIGTIIEN
ncbi:MAG: UMP kinase [Candidatus Gracilibacteria bacterium]|nr:UMP kinase [Candidatus Gracilibacteria bacterium]MDD3120679.1 UMP kinase [Candidatus Gracilibacteria bacterium]MDD4530939.1 UMP kinase [Candidatus Gracilibacteria bacterium]